MSAAALTRLTVVAPPQTTSTTRSARRTPSSVCYDLEVGQVRIELNREIKCIVEQRPPDFAHRREPEMAAEGSSDVRGSTGWRGLNEARHLRPVGAQRMLGEPEPVADPREDIACVLGAVGGGAGVQRRPDLQAGEDLQQGGGMRPGQAAVGDGRGQYGERGA